MNCVDIYENDIVEIQFESRKVIASIEMDVDNVRYVAQGANNFQEYQFPFNQLWVKKMSVIGNVCKNPELLVKT